MTWQLRRACLAFLPVLWPAFTFWDLAAAILLYQRHLRSRGGEGGDEVDAGEDGERERDEFEALGRSCLRRTGLGVPEARGAEGEGEGCGGSAGPSSTAAPGLCACHQGQLLRGGRCLAQCGGSSSLPGCCCCCCCRKGGERLGWVASALGWPWGGLGGSGATRSSWAHSEWGSAAEEAHGDGPRGAADIGTGSGPAGSASSQPLRPLLPQQHQHRTWAWAWLSGWVDFSGPGPRDERMAASASRASASDRCCCAVDSRTKPGEGPLGPQDTSFFARGLIGAGVARRRPNACGRGAQEHGASPSGGMKGGEGAAHGQGRLFAGGRPAGEGLDRGVGGPIARGLERPLESGGLCAGRVRRFLGARAEAAAAEVAAVASGEALFAPHTWDQILHDS